MNKARRLAKGLQNKAVRYTVALALLLAQIWTLAIPVPGASAIGLYPGGQNLLAASMSNLVPGETETQTITIKNIGNETGTFYLRAERAEEGDYASQEAFSQGQKILDALEMRIYVYDGSNTKTLLYEGRANQTNPDTGAELMDRRILLGSLGSNDEIRIEVEVAVPAGLDNSYSGQGKFWWHFTSEGAAPPSSSSHPDSNSKPGDSSYEGSTSGQETSGPGGGTTSTSRPTGQTPASTPEDGWITLVTIPADDDLHIEHTRTVTTLHLPGGWALVNLILSLLCLLGSIIMAVRMLADAMKRRRQDEEEREDIEVPPARTLYLAGQGYTDKAEEEQPPDEPTQKRSRVFRLLVVLLGVLAILVFFLTENLATPMRLLDRWTPLMAIIALADILAWLLSKKKREDEEEDDTPEDTPPAQSI